MRAIEFEAQKAFLARKILCMEDENMIYNIYSLLNYPIVYKQNTTEKRQLGILDGKAKIVFKDDFEMTTEELINLQ